MTDTVIWPNTLDENSTPLAAFKMKIMTSYADFCGWNGYRWLNSSQTAPSVWKQSSQPKKSV